jgi:hypothetical protein
MQYMLSKISCIWVLFFTITNIHASQDNPRLNAENIDLLNTCSEQGEFPIDTSIIYVSARGGQASARITSDSTNFFIVWQDDRSQYRSDIFCTRVDVDGNVLDPAGIPVITVCYDNVHSYYPANPVVAYNGNVYFIVWQDARFSPTYEYDIYGTRVTPFGVVIDTNAIAISTAGSRQTYPSVVSNGSDFTVVWEDERNGATDIYGARVSGQGLVLDPDGIPVCTCAYSQDVPSVMSDGTDYFAVWEDTRNTGGGDYDIYGARLDANGNVLDPDGIAITSAPSSQYHCAVAFGDTNYLVVWEESNQPYPDVYGARVNTAGIVLDPNGFAISSLASSPEMEPKVTFDRTNFLVVWKDDRNGTYPDIYGARVSQAGTVLDPAGIPISLTYGVKNTPCTGFNGTNYLVTWSDDRDDIADDIFGARIDPNGTVLDTVGFNISTAAVFQNYPGIGYDGTNYLIAWTDYRQGLYYSDIFGARVDPSGTILDSPGFVICNAPFGQYSPALDFDGQNYLAVWTHNIGGAWNVRGTRIDQNGTILDPSYLPIATSSDAMSPDVAYCEPYYLTVWIDYRNSYTSPDIYGARINVNGVILDGSGIPISQLSTLEYGCSVGAGQDGYLVVWEDNRAGYKDLYGSRIDINGTVLDPTGIAVSTADSTQDACTVAFNGSIYFVVWQDKRNGTHDIYGARITVNGNVLDPDGIPIAIGASEQISPCVDYDGTYFVVVWEEDFYYPFNDLFGAVIDSSGIIVDEFTVSEQPRDQGQPAVACGSSNACVAYSSWTSTINNQPANAIRIWGVFPSYVGISEQNLYRPAIIEQDMKIYPNPVFGNAQITYTIDASSSVEITLYDITGRLVRTLLREHKDADIYSHVFDTADLAPGIYFVQLKIGNRTATKKIIIAR